MSLPCEVARWNTIPRIRKRIVYYLVRELNMNQRECAEKLDLTTAAVSLYMSGKRGKGEDFDERMEEEIRRSAHRIAEGKNPAMEICRLCSMLQ